MQFSGRRLLADLWRNRTCPRTQASVVRGSSWVGLQLLVFLVLGCTAWAKPNFVFLLVDDMGYMDIGANNPDTFYETPNIDRLAATGVRFTNGYAANPVCSPTRFSIMTGKYPSRADATNFFSGKRAGKFLPAPLHDRMDLSEVTIAEALRDAGYRTAFFGKWHLGPTEEFWPTKQGFDLNFGGFHRGLPPGGYFSPYKNPRLIDGKPGEHLPTRLVDEAMQTLEAFKGDPFLLYVSFYSVHTPLQAPKSLIQKYKDKSATLAPGPEFGKEEQVLPNAKRERSVRIRQRHATYAAMVESMDTQIGRLLQKLDELGLSEDTVVMLTADNGGLSTSEGLPTSNLPLRGGKGWVYEGGIREPFIVRWPKAAASGTVCHEPVVSTDFYPTILDIAGLPLNADQHKDGTSLVPLLKNDRTSLGREALYWHYPHYSNQGGFPGGAIRMGDFKLIERYEDGRSHLYNIQQDIGEQTDLAPQHPELVDKMRDKLHAWYATVHAKFLQSKPGERDQPWQPTLRID